MVLQRGACKALFWKLATRRARRKLREGRIWEQIRIMREKKTSARAKILRAADLFRFLSFQSS